MASKVLVVFVMLLFLIAVVGAIPKFVLRSENQDDINCNDIDNEINSSTTYNFCRPYLDIIYSPYLYKRYTNATEDLYRNVSQQLTAFCASQCKHIIVTYFNCHNNIHAATFYNNGVCGKINQEFCYVHHLRGTTAGTIVTLDTLFDVCPYNSNTESYYCVEGACQRNVTQWTNYMGCCAGSLLHPGFTNLTSCGITDTTPCSSGTVAISSSVFIMIAIAIIQMYGM